MKLDAVGDRQAVPSECNVTVVRNCFIRAGTKRGRKRLRNLPLERITGDVAQLGADGIEALPLALSDLDGQQLQEMPVPVRRAGTGSLRPIE